eukprot:gene4188-14291_t
MDVMEAKLGIQMYCRHRHSAWTSWKQSWVFRCTAAIGILHGRHGSKVGYSDVLPPSAFCMDIMEAKLGIRCTAAIGICMDVMEAKLGIQMYCRHRHSAMDVMEAKLVFRCTAAIGILHGRHGAKLGIQMYCRHRHSAMAVMEAKLGIQMYCHHQPSARTSLSEVG